jgi:hypothetical protein
MTNLLSLPAPMYSLLIGGLFTLFALRTHSKDFGLAELISLIIGLGLFLYGANSFMLLTNLSIGS